LIVNPLFRKEGRAAPEGLFMESMTLGISSCPNDTYIFHALFAALVPSPVPLAMHMADVEELNHLALTRALPMSKVSLGVVPEIMDDYALFSSGAALGWGCGPLVVARTPLDAQARAQARIATPGEHTTANLLLTLTGQFKGSREAMLFSDVMPAVKTGRADAGVIIHEGRFTFEKEGLVKLLDLGQWWEEEYHAPLPLGVIVVRRDVAAGIALAMQEAIAQSLRYAHAHPEAGRSFIQSHAQELAPSVIDAHIATFVTDFSMDLGEQGKNAITMLVQKAAQAQGRQLPAAGLFV
jgi:1,4-dihydroxy-6-naphthoate synthase